MKLFKTIETTFDNFDTNVRSYVIKVFNNLGLQYTHTQLFDIIFETIKGVMQNIMFYIEDAFTEQNAYTATRRKSLFSLAKISGFEPYYGSSAGGTLIAKLHINNGLNNKRNNIYIKNHSTVINKTTGIIYSIIIPTEYFIVNISNPLIEYQLNIHQGIFQKAQYAAKGNELETIHINTIELFDKQYVTVKVDGEIWECCSSLYDMSNDSKEYVLQIGYDNTFDIIFGNGIYGRKLIDGQVVEIEYLKHQGTLGNIVVGESYNFQFNDYGSDTLGNSVNLNDYINLDVNTCISGGSDADTIEFIQSMIGNNSRSLIYSSADNMQLFLKRFSFIGYNNCFASLKYNKIYVLGLQNINNIYRNDKTKYFELTNDELLLTDDQKNMILTTLENSNKTLAGFTVEFINPIIRKYSLIFYVKIKNVYDKDIVKEIINNSMLNYFISLSHDIKFIPKSDLINCILNNDIDKLIESIEINIISEYNEQAYYNKEYVAYLSDIIDDGQKYIINKYTDTSTPGLDIFGNISLNTITEIPRICGGFKYYINKNANNKSEDSIITKPIDIYFI